MSFANLGLSQNLLRAIEKQGYNNPTEIQKLAIPLVLEGNDLMAQAATGSGKTASFTLPLIQKLCESTKSADTRHARVIRAIILTPTRELAQQVSDSVKTYGEFAHLRSTSVYGGVSFYNQIRELKRGVDILIATPGRLLDHINRGTIDLSNVETFILDEADRMLDMGFIHDIKHVLTLLPKQRQGLLFSATFSKEIKDLASKFLKDPKLIQTEKQNTTAKNVKHLIHPVDAKRKRELLSHIIESRNLEQVLVFARTKHGADRLSELLLDDGLNAAAIHGNKSQAARTKTLEKFKAGKIRILVATDVAARGLDIRQLNHVINYDLPDTPEDYVHRIGRTGRAENLGEALSLVSAGEIRKKKAIEQLIKQTIEEIVIKGFEPTEKASSADKEGSRNPRRRGAGPARGGRSYGGGRPSFGDRGGRSGGRGGERSERSNHARSERSSERATRGENRERSGRSERPAYAPRGEARGERAPRGEGRREFGSRDRTPRGENRERSSTGRSEKAKFPRGERSETRSSASRGERTPAGRRDSAPRGRSDGAPSRFKERDNRRALSGSRSRPDSAERKPRRDDAAPRAKKSFFTSRKRKDD